MIACSRVTWECHALCRWLWRRLWRGLWQGAGRRPPQGQRLRWAIFNMAVLAVAPPHMLPTIQHVSSMCTSCLAAHHSGMRSATGFGGGRFDDEPGGGSRWRTGAPAAPTPTSPTAADAAPGDRPSLTARHPSAAESCRGLLVLPKCASAQRRRVICTCIFQAAVQADELVQGFMSQQAGIFVSQLGAADGACEAQVEPVWQRQAGGRQRTAEGAGGARCRPQGEVLVTETTVHISLKQLITCH